MDMMHATDWVPTLYGLAGGNTSKLENLDGFDMWPTLAHGEQNPRSEILINIDGDDSALRFQQWKFVNTSNVHRRFTNYDTGDCVLVRHHASRQYVNLNLICLYFNRYCSQWLVSSSRTYRVQ